MIKSKKPLVIPGVYDAIGAKIAEKVGFDAMFQTGYGTSATLFGMPDYGFIGATETVDNARRISNAISVPLIVDSDTGYGNALSVWKLVKELESAGAAGIFLEDQKWPKRCGHMQGKDVIPQEEYTEKLGAAIDARENKDFIIVARTDSRATEGLDKSIERGIQNKKTGADAIFIEAPRSLDEMKKIGKEIKAPLVANMIEGGATPMNSAKTLNKMGFNIILNTNLQKENKKFQVKYNYSAFLFTSISIVETFRVLPSSDSKDSESILTFPIEYPAFSVFRATI
jgi:methylisocitrate lyase